MDPNADNPYLHGSYAPIQDERCDDLLEVRGELPPDLCGSYVRNGPNPQFAPPGRHHWFDGDGMLHAVAFGDGKAVYRNRWIRTRGFLQEREAGRALWSGILESIAGNPREQPYKDTANTDVVFHQGRLLTSWYVCGRPYLLHPSSLETEEVAAFARGEAAERGPRTLSAHPKVDARTGELMFFDYGLRPPFMSYGVVDAAGKLKSHTDVALPAPRLPHDMAITERYSILMDLPVGFCAEAMARGRWKSEFFSELPARFGVLPRHAPGTEVRWFEAEPCYIYHVVNAWEQGDEIILVACRVEQPIGKPRPEDGRWAQMLANLRMRARLHRYRFNLTTGATREEPVDDLNTEFPTIDMRQQGRPTRRSYHVSIADSPTLLFDGLVTYDTDSGQSRRFGFGPGRYGSEPAFAPRTGGGPDEGYLVTFVHDEGTGESEVQVFDADQVESGPRASMRLPRRVPLGFHACWVSGEGS